MLRWLSEKKLCNDLKNSKSYIRNLKLKKNIPFNIWKTPKWEKWGYNGHLKYLMFEFDVLDDKDRLLLIKI